MKIGFITAAASLALMVSPVLAQEVNSTSGSDATSTSGSNSGAASNSDQAQGQSQNANNAGIGNSESHSNSGANANSSTSSNSAAFGNDQGQTQGQSANNSQGQSQGQTTTAQQGNMQGVQINQTTNATQRRTTHQEFRTNTAVPLAASSSFSSDYCGGTASGGASAAPLGISIGGAAPVFDKSCQSLRRAEKFGMLAANYNNLGQPEMALKAMSLMAWSICTADSQGPRGDKSTAQACLELALLGQGAMKPSDPSIPSTATPPAAYQPKTTQSNGQPTSEAVAKAAGDQRSEKLSLIAVGH